MSGTYNPRQANKGRALEELIEYQNQIYRAKHIANIQKISTPWQVIRRGKSVVSAFPLEKSTLDFRGTIRGAIPVSFDAKESEDARGLPLRYIKRHQIDYIRLALELGEISFILCHIKPIDAYCIIPGKTVLAYWDRWMDNKGKRGFNFIPVEAMDRIARSHSPLDYACVLLKEKEEIA